jgi:glycosyltransferase involved in cell wall biosynthesis
MKVLIVNSSQKGGGAARAASRLHDALLSCNVDSHLLIQSGVDDSPRIISPKSKLAKAIVLFRPMLDRLPLVRYKHRTKGLFSPNYLPSKSIIKQINEFNPDIVHLHWINDGMIRIEELAHIRAPIVWSLHDMWAFTGGCHYDEGCSAHISSCNNCKVLGSTSGRDLSSWGFKRKRNVFAKLDNFVVIGLSRWLAQEAEKSALLSQKRVISLPNPIDTSIFSPVNMKVARDLLNLPQDKKLILFGAIGATSDPRKGFKQLSAALENFNDNDFELLIFGSNRPQEEQGFKQKTRYLGHLYDDVSLKLLYSASDITVVPSLQENLSNTIMESMACGTPVVAFNIGGNSDLIQHNKTGYLAQAFDELDMARGIMQILNSEFDKDYRVNAREAVVKKFDNVKVAKQYIELYKSIVKN